MYLFKISEDISEQNDLVAKGLIIEGTLKANFANRDNEYVPVYK